MATRPDADAAGGERVIGFASAVVRGASWLLSMLFVLPEEQGLGLGRALIEAVLPPADAGLALNTAIDSRPADLDGARTARTGWFRGCRCSISSASCAGRRPSRPCRPG